MTIDYNDINKKKRDPKTIFRQLNVQEEQKHVKKHEPYCFRCAKFDFEDMIDKTQKNVSRGGLVDESDLKINLDKIDLKKYSDIKRFTLLAESDAVDSVLIIGGHRKTSKIGINMSYQCNECNAKITVFEPTPEKNKENK